MHHDNLPAQHRETLEWWSRKRLRNWMRVRQYFLAGHALLYGFALTPPDYYEDRNYYVFFNYEPFVGVSLLTIMGYTWMLVCALILIGRWAFPASQLRRIAHALGSGLASLLAVSLFLGAVSPTWLHLAFIAVAHYYAALDDPILLRIPDEEVPEI